MEAHPVGMPPAGRQGPASGWTAGCWAALPAGWPDSPTPVRVGWACSAAPAPPPGWPSPCCCMPGGSRGRWKSPGGDLRGAGAGGSAPQPWVGAGADGFWATRGAWAAGEPSRWRRTSGGCWGAARQWTSQGAPGGARPVRPGGATGGAGCHWGRWGRLCTSAHPCRKLQGPHMAVTPPELQESSRSVQSGRRSCCMDRRYAWGRGWEPSTPIVCRGSISTVQIHLISTCLPTTR